MTLKTRLERLEKKLRTPREFIGLYLPADLKAEVETAAKQQERTVAAWIRAAIQEKLARNGAVSPDPEDYAPDRA